MEDWEIRKLEDWVKIFEEQDLNPEYIRQEYIQRAALGGSLNILIPFV